MPARRVVLPPLAPYVAAFEAVLAKTIVDLAGPVEWALPYWNYLDATNPASRDIPRAFTDPTLPDGTPNPLAQAPRHGVSRLGPTPWLPTDITLAAMNERTTRPPPAPPGSVAARRPSCISAI